MIGLDTNVLLRAATNDDAMQSPIARRILETLTSQSPGYIDIIVLSEFAWSLERRYDYSRSQIIRALETLLSSTSYVVAERDVVSRALSRVEEHDLEFPDALICELNREAGCSVTMTFDTTAARVSGFKSAY
jgi:predicted nucleic-acid-binding protein